MTKKQVLSLAFISAIGLASAGCTAPDAAKEALENDGRFHNIEAGGTGFWKCQHGDRFFATRFKAENQKGDEVKGTVCMGLLKGKDIRLD